MDQYGIKITPTNGAPQMGVCNLCKYKYANINVEPCSSCDKKSYYVPIDEGVRIPEAEKLEREQIIVQDFFKVKSKKDNELSKQMQAMVNNPDNSLADAYTKKVESEMQVFYDTQKELIDLRVELRVEKEKSKALEEYSRGLELKVKELEGTIENNVTEVSKFFHDGVEIFECNSCRMLMEENEPYDNYCPNCGRKIKK